MNLTFEVENIKCGGCANTIRKKIDQIDSVSNVNVDVENNTISLDADESMSETIYEKLKDMGYPKRGTTHGLESATTKAKSFVSCAIGRMSD